MGTAAEVRMVLYEDDSVQVNYADGSTLQLSPCGSEFLFEKAPPPSTHPLEQPERIRQRTHFVISNYRRVFIDFSEVEWPSPDRDDCITYSESGIVKITSLDGHAYLCLPRSQHEFTVHFLCKVSQKPDSSVMPPETKNRVPKEELVGKTRNVCRSGRLSGQRLRNKENEPPRQLLTSKNASANIHCVSETEGREELPSPGTKRRYVHVWVKQSWSAASCPEEWKYPLSLGLRFYNKVPAASAADAEVPVSGIVTSDNPEERGTGVSVLPRALLLSCSAPHMHRWNFCDSLLQRQSDAEEYSYPELIKVVWYKGVTYRLTHKNVNSIEIFPGDGSVFKSEGTHFGNYFTYSSQDNSGKREEKTYSVNNLPPDRPGNLYSVRSLIKQATRILQHCAKIRLSLSHNYRVCCWRMAPGVNVSSILPVLLKESLIPGVGRFLAYSDDKVHAVFLDGVTLTLNWDLSSSAEKTQVDQGLRLRWCRLTFPDGQDQLIQTEHPGVYERSVASELEKIQKFNWLLENSGVLNLTSGKKNEQCSSDHCKPGSSETLPEATNEESVSVALKRTSEVLQDIDYLLSLTRK
ncbi:similar to 4833420G17Rik protein, isoform CRA_b [Rattus norvegicus]|uniref:Similar to 4833420G17Rik protein, isoform CRA_b n=2 Tax=Rattus norvegicus TaxID=10116 RepID=A6I5V9_RAT|nr:similar to 4833420G17Rik protein, isoform CRA_b [Rattus norvegicus]EDM10417.1 similar to 4833420G17Rik protein, isoform CRA_b [Rattus norvegicus]